EAERDEKPDEQRAEAEEEEVEAPEGMHFEDEQHEPQQRPQPPRHRHDLCALRLCSIRRRVEAIFYMAERGRVKLRQLLPRRRKARNLRILPSRALPK